MPSSARNGLLGQSAVHPPSPGLGRPSSAHASSPWTGLGRQQAALPGALAGSRGPKALGESADRDGCWSPGCTRALGLEVSARVRRTARRLKYASSRQASAGQPLFVSVAPDGSDHWRLEPVVEILRSGGVGIIPTDTLPAVVCDVGDKDAVERLYAAKDLDPKKPLSILCRGFSDIGVYTLGFPVSNVPGRRDTFNLAKQVLPGAYTFILPASKKLPKQVLDFDSGKSKQRRSVGVRMPDDPIAQAILKLLDRPLLCSSMHIDVQANEAFELPDAMSLMDMYSGSGIDFMVDVGRRVAEESTVRFCDNFEMSLGLKHA